MAILVGINFSTEIACTNICEDIVPSDFTAILVSGQDGGVQVEGWERTLGKSLSLKFEQLDREKQENYWPEWQEQKGEVPALVNLWLQVSRSQEDVGEGEG